MIIHTHIPKTGGTTLNSIFKRAFPNSHVEIPPLEGRIRFTDEQARAVIEQHRDARVIFGHQLRFPCPVVAGVEYQYVGILRDPRERAVSLYYYERRRFASNPQHRCNRPLPEFLKLLEELDYGSEQCHWLHASGDVREARRVIDQYAVIGVTEQFDAILLLMHARLGVPWSALLSPRLNTSKARGASAFLDDKTLEYLNRAFAPDMELHAHARDLLTVAVAEQGRHFPLQVSTLRFANRALDRESRLRQKLGGKTKGLKRRMSRRLRPQTARPE